MLVLVPALLVLVFRLVHVPLLLRLVLVPAPLVPAPTVSAPLVPEVDTLSDAI